MKKLTKISLTMMLTVIMIILFGAKSLAVNITSDMVNEFITGYANNAYTQYIKDFISKYNLGQADVSKLNDEVKAELQRRQNRLQSPEADQTIVRINTDAYEKANKASKALDTYYDSVYASQGSGSSGTSGTGTTGSGTSTSGGTSIGFGDLKGQGDSFIQKGSKNEQITENEIIAILVPIGRVLVQIATVVLVVVGMIFGVKYMMAGADEKAKLKEKLIWYIISIVLVYGAVGIFTIVRTVIESTLGN